PLSYSSAFRPAPTLPVFLRRRHHPAGIRRMDTRPPTPRRRGITATRGTLTNNGLVTMPVFAVEDHFRSTDLHRDRYLIVIGWIAFRMKRGFSRRLARARASNRQFSWLFLGKCLGNNSRLGSA